MTLPNDERLQKLAEDSEASAQRYRDIANNSYANQLLRAVSTESAKRNSDTAVALRTLLAIRAALRSEEPLVEIEAILGGSSE